MFFCQFIFCVIFMAISTSPITIQQIAVKRRPQDDFDFSSEDFTNTPNISPNLPFSETVDNSKNTMILSSRENPQEPVANLLKELGNTLPQRVYRKIYNESKSTKVCWRTITYIKSNLINGEVSPWREYEVIFDFPNPGHSNYTEPNNGDTVIYRVRDPDHGIVELLNFTLTEKNQNFTLYKNEKISCGFGNFLTKTYYEWPRSDRKRVVVKLSEKPGSPDDPEVERVGQNLEKSYQKPGIGDQDLDVAESRRVGSYDQNSGITNDSSDNMEGYGVLDSEADMDNINNTTYVNENRLLLNESENKNSQSKNQRNAELYKLLMQHQKNRSNIITDENSSVENTYPEKQVIESEEDFMDLTVGASAPRIVDLSLSDNNQTYGSDDILVGPEEKARSDAMATSKGSTSTLDPCSPILTTLLSGNGILPGLCSLRKNEKVVLRGDITVSKKYFNQENTEIIEPLFTIRENTEIRAHQENKIE